MKYEYHFSNQHQKLYHISKAQPNYFFCSVQISGIAGDLGLKKYLKTRMTIEKNNVQLVPWKSGDQITEQAKNTIPLRATLITFTTSIIFFIGLIIITIFGNEDCIIILLLYGCAQLPLIIGLTVKLNQKKIVPQQPQQQLNFHDEEHKV